MTKPFHPTRRALAAPLAALGLAVLGRPRRANASAPFARSQPPGFVRTGIGGFEVTALSDGASPLDALKVTNQPAARTQEALSRAVLPNPLALSDTAYLINTGTRLVLADTGGSGYFGAALGHLQHSLAAAGYQPDQVDDVLLTHMHRDHVGGLLQAGRPAFPNATVHASRREAEYWLSAANRASAPPQMQSRFQGVAECLAPYIAAGRFHIFDPDAQVLPGITAIAAYGHSQGHVCYRVANGPGVLWIIGDLVVVSPVQFASPGISTTLDADPAQATASRARILARIAAEGALLGGAHIGFPGLGHVTPQGAGFAWAPLPSDPYPT